ncbi:uncharacterized protein SOCE26_028700 [Sorangium cellulosum]|uniref:Uncharacterized protein n=2 Tax=Sorangium cellulosum TaxID=56 RepID=A0A2L0EQ75_SORCE|nr:uncharacterized protein SOCE26_028700 [Sorangium cellulosum]
MGTINLGGETHTHEGSRAAIVAKYTNRGEFLWSQMFNDDMNTAAKDTATDSRDNLIVTGVADCHGCSDETSHMWINKYDSTGALTWRKTLPKYAEGPLVTSIAVDPFDNIITTGDFVGTNAFDGDALTSRGGSDIFIVKYTGDGDLVWAASYGDEADQKGTSVASDNLGNVVLLGTFAGTINFFTDGSKQLSASSERDIFIAKLSSAKVPLWSKSFESSAGAWGSRVAVDANGDILFTGSFNEEINFGGETLSSRGATDIHLVKLAANGDHSWSRAFGNDQEQAGFALAPAPDGRIWLGATTRGDLMIGRDRLSAQGGLDIVLSMFAP